MKKTNKNIGSMILTAALFVAALPACAKTAGGDSSQSSTREQVAQVVQEAKSIFIPAKGENPDLGQWDTAYITGGPVLEKEAQNIQNPRLKALLNAMTEKTNAGLKNNRWDYAYLVDLRDSEITPKYDGPCVDEQGNLSEAATTPTLKSPICISIGLLTSIPTKELKSRISALLVREVSRHFGASNEEKMLLEKYFSTEVLSRRASIRVEAKYVYSNFNSGLDKIIQSLSKDSQDTTCSLYEEIHLSMSAGSDTFDMIDVSMLQDSDKSLAHYKTVANDLYKNVQKPYWKIMTSYCEQNASVEETSVALSNLKSNYKSFKVEFDTVLPVSF